MPWHHCPGITVRASLPRSATIFKQAVGLSISIGKVVTLDYRNFQFCDAPGFPPAPPTNSPPINSLQIGELLFDRTARFHFFFVGFQVFCSLGSFLFNDGWRSAAATGDAETWNDCEHDQCKNLYFGDHFFSLLFK